MTSLSGSGSAGTKSPRLAYSTNSDLGIAPPGTEALDPQRELAAGPALVLVVHKVAVVLRRAAAPEARRRRHPRRGVGALEDGGADLVARAKTKALTADDLQGGSYTLSNPGPFGTLFTAPIINQPQVGILSMDAVKKRAHVVESESGDAIEIRPIGILAHSFDHRAIDGAYSAAYLQKLKSIIEDTDWNSEF